MVEGIIGIALVLLASLLVLAKASQLVIKHAIVLARFLRLSELAAGFLLVSVATSLPEFLIAVFAGLKNEPVVSIGNVFGANIGNLLLIMGASALVGGVVVYKSELRRLTNLVFLVSLLPFLLFFYKEQASGIVLLAFFAAFVYIVLKKGIALEEFAEKVLRKQAIYSAFVFAIGVTLIVYSARFAVDSAVSLALFAGVSEAFIGATVMAIGTTIPELSVNLAAVRQKKSSLALGNALGSCVTNLTLVLGASITLSKIAPNPFAFIHLIAFMLVACFAVWLLLFRKKLGKLEGIALIALYAAFLAFASLVEVA